jgi:WD40 repeat protein
LFSGSKDGIVKVWRQSEGTYGDLVCKAKLEGNASDSSVNAICKIETKSGSAFACGSSDKSIRIWAQP